MATTTDLAWRDLAAALAAELAADDVLHDPAWRQAVEQTPRHVFVPTFHTQRPDGQWTTTDSSTAAGLRTCYANDALITTLAALPDGQKVSVSSSSKPGLMVRMLEALDIQPGHRVLEIGTGTGYNAALLCHRLGDDRVASVDIGAELVDSARARLAGLGWKPQLEAVDGADGVPGPWDRIIGTCSVPVIPQPWAGQLREGGLLLVDLKPSTHAGNLVLLSKNNETLSGRFLPRWAGFMPMRHEDAAPVTASVGDVDDGEGELTDTQLAPEPWAHLVPWLLAHVDLPAGVAFGYRGVTESGPEHAVYAAPDGSWCSVGMRSDNQGWREVRQGGPLRLWDALERWCSWWSDEGSPEWERFGLTVRADGAHVLWLDDSTNTLGAL